jgi:hypothetical protein
MSGIDIFYLSLVVVAFTGYAAALAYFIHADGKFRAARDAAQGRAARSPGHDDVMRAA